MAIIYTNQSSGAIRKAKNKKPTRAYQLALTKHIKWLKSKGFNVDDNGNIQFTSSGNYGINIAERTISNTGPQCSNKIVEGGTKPDNSWKIEASKNFTIAPAYNKGPYMVVNKSDLKTAGRKI